MQVRHVIGASPQQVWNVLIDTHQWPVWGPSVRAVQSPRRYIDDGLKGCLQTVLGFWVPFEITGFEPLNFWSWKVAGIQATGHRLITIDKNHCELIFEMPLAVFPYALICRQAARRIGLLARSERS
ncbi:SRPBCC family protein [Pelovirga terrestris]|uniref:SRPBCC family protein n=1 Tax=Pelovirga terrestris TaxID=2771352 RepID=A0A8J6UHE7_9BACT|nr:SRPBCC family protein [Pelovirga terrestris]MBD1401338.1 SRPBCC family protein [Pelovirga terrestris]